MTTALYSDNFSGSLAPFFSTVDHGGATHDLTGAKFNANITAYLLDSSSHSVDLNVNPEIIKPGDYVGMKVITPAYVSSNNKDYGDFRLAWNYGSGEVASLYVLTSGAIGAVKTYSVNYYVNDGTTLQTSSASWSGSALYVRIVRSSNYTFDFQQSATGSSWSTVQSFTAGDTTFMDTISSLSWAVNMHMGLVSPPTAHYNDTAAVWSIDDFEMQYSLTPVSKTTVSAWNTEAPPYYIPNLTGNLHSTGAAFTARG